MNKKEDKIIKKVPVEAKKTSMKEEETNHLKSKKILKHKNKSAKIEIKEAPTRTTQEMEELIEIRKKTHTVKLIMLAFVAVLLLLLLINPTFFKKTYKNDNVNIELPRFTYLISDTDKEITLKTIRKSEYLKDYFDKYLNDNFATYTCEDGSKVFYNKDVEPATIIYEYKISKSFGIKTITIRYGSTAVEENSLCDAK